VLSVQSYNFVPTGQAGSLTRILTYFNTKLSRFNEIMGLQVTKTGACAGRDVPGAENADKWL